MKEAVLPHGKAGPTKLLLESLLSGLLWGVAIFMLVFTGLLVWHHNALPAVLQARGAHEQVGVVETATVRPELALNAPMPAYSPSVGIDALVRFANSHTVIPTRSRSGLVNYTVQKGDSIFAISTKYGIKPESVLWANYSTLKDNPDMVSVGADLNIPPTDGVMYQWQDQDTLDGVAAKFRAKVQDILNWPGNKLDLANPVIKTGMMVMIPGGWREMRSWIIPTVWKANSGASRNIPGGCATGGGAVGSGHFIWPSQNHYLSGNDYWSGHLGIDIAAGLGAPVSAADSGVVVYAAPIGGGYGNMVMIDHGNGYHTIYAHLSQINTSCGASVGQGTLIGLAGSTGNSTGPHLHFEVRYMGGFINPWTVLPR